jgi:hypothetical protein
MADIDVKKTDGGRYEVTVRSDTATRHQVTQTDEYHQQLTGGKLTPKQLIDLGSFEYSPLLDPRCTIAPFQPALAFS